MIFIVLCAYAQRSSTFWTDLVLTPRVTILCLLLRFVHIFKNTIMEDINVLLESMLIFTVYA